MISILAPAKVNLMLHVVGRLSAHYNHYHHLQTLITFVDYGDILTLKECCNQDSLKIMGQFASVLSDLGSNSITKAKEWFYHYFNLPELFFNLELEKNLPVAAGIGGGTSDAAAMIAALLAWHQINLSLSKKQQLILASGVLGADLPVCLSFQLGLGNLFWLDGTGVEDSPQSLVIAEPLHLVLINPGILVNTGVVFQALNGNFSPSLEFPILKTKADLMRFLIKTQNDLQEPAKKAYSQTQSISQSLQMIVGQENIVRQSGSGSTYFCMSESSAIAQHLAVRITKNHPRWWVRYAQTIVKAS